MEKLLLLVEFILHKLLGNCSTLNLHHILSKYNEIKLKFAVP